jgi:response regulator of citrate/malate metabolism
MDDKFVRKCKKFHATLMAEQQENEKRMDKIIKQYQKELHEMKEKSQGIYESVLQWMIEATNHDDCKEFLDSLQGVINDVTENPEKMDMYAEIFRNCTELIKKKKNIIVTEEYRQFPCGKKPLYFDFF